MPTGMQKGGVMFQRGLKHLFYFMVGILAFLLWTGPHGPHLDFILNMGGLVLALLFGKWLFAKTTHPASEKRFVDDPYTGVHAAFKRRMPAPREEKEDDPLFYKKSSIDIDSVPKIEDESGNRHTIH